MIPPPLIWLIAGVVGAFFLFKEEKAMANIPPQEPTPERTGGDWELPGTGAPYADAIASATAKWGLPDRLLGRVLYQESRFRPDIISGETASPAGALGIAQFMPATAVEYNVDPLDPESAIDGAAHYLHDLFTRFGTWPEAIGAYNNGPGNIAKHGVAGAPRETREYVASVTHDVFGSA